MKLGYLEPNECFMYEQQQHMRGTPTSLTGSKSKPLSLSSRYQGTNLKTLSSDMDLKRYYLLSHRPAVSDSESDDIYYGGGGGGSVLDDEYFLTRRHHHHHHHHNHHNRVSQPHMQFSQPPPAPTHHRRGTAGSGSGNGSGHHRHNHHHHHQHATSSSSSRTNTNPVNLAGMDKTRPISKSNSSSINEIYSRRGRGGPVDYETFDPSVITPPPPQLYQFTPPPQQSNGIQQANSSSNSPFGNQSFYYQMNAGRGAVTSNYAHLPTSVSSDQFGSTHTGGVMSLNSGQPSPNSVNYYNRANILFLIFVYIVRVIHF